VKSNTILKRPTTMMSDVMTSITTKRGGKKERDTKDESMK
jgi:hypothetical protein